MYGQTIENRRLLLIERRVVLICRGPRSRSILLWQPVAKDCERASGYGREAIVPAGRLATLVKSVKRLSVVLLKFIGAVGLVCAHRPVEAGAASPCQQIAFLVRPLHKQQVNILFASGKTVHVVGQEAGEDVFPKQ